ncbi:uncharacterized protein LAESUDRAFT_687938 [Laetiporus sulphureus 93-53]|uniref:NYN domain-containing protein n=1 Tax=Laetiporus sulphureus 93-53 TaxID=1314785 RepID=A0A165BAP9_9APHY|nr:uncharacterized protein LAESUDRAFT_687938 [Laetiporus sulphureus 93-53]KZT00631.1 hypothetical protein LAESUDRAFT_687938 [Laetiporus sulphureus 93-53]
MLVLPPIRLCSHSLTTRPQRRSLPSGTHLSSRYASLSSLGLHKAKSKKPDSGQGHRVALFWDYENIPVPSTPANVRGLIVQQLCQLARKYGRVDVLRLYTGIWSANSEKNTLLRKAMHAEGMELVMCEHGGLRQVVDTKIMADIDAYTRLFPPPATIIIVSGDKDYLPTVSELIRKQFQVVVVCPKTAQPRFTAIQNCKTRRWPEDLAKA